MNYCSHYWGYGQRLVEGEWFRERFCWISDCHLNEVFKDDEWVEIEATLMTREIAKRFYVARL